MFPPIKILNEVSEREVLTALNTQPPDPQTYVRFLEAHWKAANPQASPRPMAALIHRFPPWIADQPTGAAELFTQNYLVRAPFYNPPATAPSPPRAPAEQKLSRVIGDALVSAYLRELVDAWLESGRGTHGSESPAGRNLFRAHHCWEVVYEFLQQHPPSLEPDIQGTGFKLTIAPTRWKPRLSGSFFAIQRARAHRLFIGILTSPWAFRLCKCRHPRCGRYFVATQIRRSYRHGTFCSREHRVYAGAQAFMKQRRKLAQNELIEQAALWLSRGGRTAAWQADPRLKVRLVAALNQRIGRSPDLVAVRGSVGVKWVTRNRAAIERQRKASIGKR
jgi:hypothetical protein